MRQGCPLPPLLFSLYLELYCLSIAHSHFIGAFALQSVEVKVIAYADDEAMFYSDRKSVSQAALLTQSFCEITGAEVSRENVVAFDMVSGVLPQHVWRA